MTGHGSLQEFGPFVIARGFEDALTLWDALHAYYLQRRPMQPAFLGFYPETTVGDVQQVAGLLTAEAEKLPRDSLGRAAAVGRWTRYRAELQQQTAGMFMFEVFPDNRRFWVDESRALALDLATAAPLPTKSEVVLDAVRGSLGGSGGIDASKIQGGSATLAPDGVSALYDEIASVVDDAGDAVKRGATAAWNAAGDLAGGAKDLIEDVGSGAKGLLKGAVGGVTDAVVSPVVDAVGKPLLIGAAVVGGLLIVPRLLDDRKGRKAA
ncbi:MAG: hypothetical protein KC464_10345 [Myxococcales bacterium]|nr:hypothetical protein [Myxococcales bacterium]